MQNEITCPQPLFNEKGLLNNPGWARKMYFQYDKLLEKIKEIK